MKGFSLKRMTVLSSFKTKGMLASSQILIYLLLPAFMAYLMKFIFSLQVDESSLPPELLSVVANIGGVLNIGSAAIVVPTMLMAEEKEKGTLRNLMVSSISPFEYLLGNLVPCLIGSFLVQLTMFPILGIVPTGSSLLIYSIYSFVALLVSVLLGMCFGLIAKNQMSASLISLPVSMIFMAIPLFGSQVKFLEKVLPYSYVGVESRLMDTLIMGDNINVLTSDYIALGGSLIVTIGVFVFMYKRVGLDSD